VLFNRGVDSGTNKVTFTAPASRGSGAGLQAFALTQPNQAGDIDGDGFYDIAAYYSLFGINGNTDHAAFLSGVGFGDGSGSGFSGQDSQAYNSAFVADSPTLGSNQELDGVPDDFGFALADINGDGLVDLIRNHFNRTTGVFANMGGGEVLFNTGTGWGNGQTAWQIPAGPNAVPGVVPPGVLPPHTVDLSLSPSHEAPSSTSTAMAL
jgi:hypothetical protein